MAVVIKPAASNMKAELLGLSNFVEEDFDSAVLYVLRWLWCVDREDLDPPVMGYKTDNLIES